MIKLTVGALVAAGAVVGVGRLAGIDLGLGSGDDLRVEGVEARRGSLRITVLERANLKAANSVKLKCELEGRSTILWLIEEGAIVEPGQLVCQLDTSAQLEKKVVQEIAVQNAEAQWVKAKQTLAIQESQNESDVKKAEQDLRFAEQDKLKYEEGEYPQELQAVDEDILLAESDLALKRNEYEWSQRLSERGFLERTRLDADEFAYETAKVKLEQAIRAKRLLTDYDHPRRLSELTGAIEEARRELDRVRLQAAARITDFEADVRTSEAKLNLERDELAKLESQIEKAEIRAPVGGMVVYAKEGGGRWGGDDPIQEGTEVRERQDIITIPSSLGMVAEMSLHESVLEKVHEGMPCLISVDALPGRQFAGRVRFKSTLPDQNSWWANPDLRVYRTEIEVLEADPGLRSGMSCYVEVVVDDLKDALHVPVQSVFLNLGEPVCFVSSRGGVEVRAIQVGQDNGKWVEVTAGLEAGEVVLLAQPPGFRLEPAIEDKPEEDEAEAPGEGMQGPGEGMQAPGGGMPEIDGGSMPDADGGRPAEGRSGSADGEGAPRHETGGLGGRGGGGAPGGTDGAGGAGAAAGDG
jgi:HlyD family secretion protein